MYLVWFYSRYSTCRGNIYKKCTMQLFGSIHLLAVPRTINKIKEMNFNLKLNAHLDIYIIIINIPAIRASELTCGSKF